MNNTTNILDNTSCNRVTAAGIDIGSNSIRMIVAEVKQGKIIRIITSQRITTRLATGICQSGKIADVPFQKSLEALTEYKKIIDNLGVTKIKTVATSAVREAENGKQFIDECKKIGINGETISGEEEAAICFCGVIAGIDTQNKRTGVFDVGGGSMEFTIGENNAVISAQSHKIGVVKLTDMFEMKNETEKNLKLCAEYISKFLENKIQHDGCQTLIATAGTASTLAAMSMKLVNYDSQKINGYTISKNEIETLLNTIIKTPYQERTLIPGLEKGRVDLIIPGILIVLEVMKQTGFKDLTISDYGLREGAVVIAARG